MASKLIAIFLLFSFGSVQAQKGVYIEAETTVEGVPVFLSKSLGMKIKIYQKKNKSLIEIARQRDMQYKLTEEKTVTLVSGKDCYSDKKSEIEKYHDDDFVIENITVTKKPETKKIASFDCKSAFISYTAKSRGYNSVFETLVWYTDKKNLEGFDTFGAMDGSDENNAYTEALKNLDGIVLGSEQIMKSTGMKTIFAITKFEMKELEDKTFNLDTKKCSKMLSYKEFKEEMKRREIRSKAAGF